MLILAATPIGNFEDSSIRLKQALETAEIVAAEDTRRALTLARRLGVQISGHLVSLHDHNEASKAADLAAQVADGKDVLVISDAGMPMINDPGFKLTSLAIAAGSKVTCLPGPSAPLVALVLSGLATHRFCFEGFLPPKSGSRQNRLAKLAAEERTMIFLESPHRIAKSLADMRDTLGGDRAAAVARELTKPHEEILRGSLTDLAQIAAQRELKGEICVVVGGGNCVQ